MASNKITWVGNTYGADRPLVMLGIFQDGGTAAIKRGELLKLDTQFKPITADHNTAATVAIANEEIKAGDRAGYYEIIVPRPGDVFEFALAAPGATAVGTALYSTTDTQVVTVTPGSNTFATAVGQEHYPLKQGHLTDDAGPDRGVTIRSIGYVRMTITAASSYYAALAK